MAVPVRMFLVFVLLTFVVAAASSLPLVVSVGVGSATATLNERMLSAVTTSRFDSRFCFILTAYLYTAPLPGKALKAASQRAVLSSRNLAAVFPGACKHESETRPTPVISQFYFPVAINAAVCGGNDMVNFPLRTSDFFPLSASM